MTFIELTKKHKEKIDNELNVFLDKQISELETKDSFINYCYELIREYTLRGGKRLRPLAVVLSYMASGGKDEKKIYLPAIAVELHHTYSLILDDIMDEDELRRHKPTIYKQLKTYFLEKYSEENYEGSLFNKKSSRFSVSFAIILGNLTNILSKKILLNSEFTKDKIYDALKLIENVDQQIYHGQMLDLLFEINKTNEKQYLDMIKLKTSVLFGLSFQLGSLFANADEYTQNEFKEVGINSALSFQIKHDILDLLGNKGHEFGADIRKGKRTLLMIKTLELVNNDQKKIINKIFCNEKATDNEINKLISIIKETGAMKHSQKLALQTNNQAKEILNKLKISSEFKQLFLELCNFMVLRNQ